MRTAALALVLATGCATSPATTPPRAVTNAPPHPSPLRLAGDVPLAPDGAGAPGSIVEATYSVCLGEDGRVAALAPRPGLPAADEAVMAALRRWSWFGAPRAHCFDQKVLLPVVSPGHLVRQASAGVVGKATAGPAPRLPKWLPALYAGSTVDAAYKVCVDDDAKVQSVRPLQSLPGADEALIASLAASTWEVVVGSLAHAPYCFASRARFDYRAPPNLDVVPPLAPYPPTAAVVTEPGVSVTPTLDNPQRQDPHLSDALKIALARRAIHELVVIYDMCVGPDGNVAELRPIKPVPGDEPGFIAALRAWHWNVLGPVGACSPLRLVFTIGN